MTFHKYFFYCTILLALLAAACHSSDSKVTARIDKILAKLDSSNQIVAGINFKKEKENAEKIEADLAFIQANFTDTLTKDMGFVLSDYRGIVAEEAEEGGKMENYEMMLKKELDYSKLQLLNLKHDIEKTDLSPEEFEKHFETESTSVSKLHAFVLNKQMEFQRKEKQFNSLQPQVQAFIDSLKK
jgi:hypothetical protein